MKSTRQTQPYRAGGSRPPSPVLDRMLAGRKGPAPGAGAPMKKALAAAGQRAKRMMPRY